MAAAHPAREPRRHDFIDALRGFAVLGVIATHVRGFCPDLDWRIVGLAESGGNGVQLFFVVSAVTLMLSWRARQDGAIPFYIRRLFRIAPMFWLALLFFGGLNRAGLWPSGGAGAGAVALTFLFLHGFSPSAINQVVPGGWSIAVEMTFYAVFPLIAAHVTTPRRAMAFAVASCVVALTVNSLVLHALQGQPTFEQVLFLYFWFPHNLPSFALGCLIYHLLPIAPRKPLAVLTLRAAVIALILWCSWAGLPWLSYLEHPVARGLVAPVACALLTLSLAGAAPALLVNRVTRFIGKVSFSAYLIHFAIYEPALRYFGPFTPPGVPPAAVFAVCMLVVSSVTVGLSALTYRFIEEPCIRAGHGLASRLAARAALPNR